MDVLLAILLLSGQPGTPEPSPSEDGFPAIRDAVHKVAIDMEILDTRETGYIFARVKDYQADLDLLRRRYREYRDAPRLCECERLPPRPFANELVSFNRAYRCHLTQRRMLELDREALFDAAIAETDSLYRMYDACRDARCETYYVPVRRAALAKLRDMLGEDGWRDMALPPNVPIHRFREQ